MAVSDRQCAWFGISYTLVLAGSLAICVWNSIKGLNGLGTNARLADAFTTATTVLSAVTIVAVGIELIMRSSMSAFLVYPCDFQKRSFCCWDYTMPKFWAVILVLNVVEFIVSAAITALLIIMVGLNEIDIIRVAPVVGVCAAMLIFTAINLKLSKTLLVKEKDEEAAETPIDEEQEPLDPAGEEMFDIPRSPLTKSPMLGMESPMGMGMRSPSVRSPMARGVPMGGIGSPGLIRGDDSQSPRWNSSLGIRPPSSPYAPPMPFPRQGSSSSNLRSSAGIRASSGVRR